MTSRSRGRQSRRQASALAPSDPAPPASTAPRANARKLEPLALRLQTLTAEYPILLSDDEPGGLTLMSLILERGGLTVRTSQEGYDTLRICRTSPLCLLITDIMKPGMSGLELIESLRSGPPEYDLPVIIVSAGSAPTNVMRAFELGVAEFVPKPILPWDFLSVVEDVLLSYY